jgi:hypothetical protein
MAVQDPEFPEKLRAGFGVRYNLLRYDGLQQDALFYGLKNWAAGREPDEPRRAAGLAVLTYLFEVCEVFTP